MFPMVLHVPPFSAVFSRVTNMYTWGKFDTDAHLGADVERKTFPEPFTRILEFYL